MIRKPRLWMMLVLAPGVAESQSLLDLIEQGKACKERKDCACAAERFQDALNLADPANKQLTGGLYLYRADALLCADRVLEALNSARNAEELLGTDQARKFREQVENRASQVVIPAEQIGRGFPPTASSGGGSGGGGAQVPVWVPFEYNSAEVKGQGAAQADELGAYLHGQLKGIILSGQARIRFRLIGHTDKRGGAAYNQDLSERRALAVKHYVIAKFGIPAGAIVSEGRGMRELLRQGDSEDDHRVNRRVVIERLP